ncbi:MAG TPA: ester cyclase [Ktedonobacteraceae bacterium]|nr:ester cyclase [Ktedonobacteraceae bacterium]
MTAADIRALVYRVYEAINAKDFVAMKELFAPYCVSHALEDAGIENGEEMLKQVSEAFPDQRFVVEDVLVDGDKAALRVTIHGVPQQPLPIIMEIFRIEKGQVAEVWGAGTLRWPVSNKG